MNALPRLLARLLPGDPVVLALPDGDEGTIGAERLVFVRKSGSGAVVRTDDAREIPAALSFSALSRRLAAHPNWFRPHVEHLINLDRLRVIRKAGANRHELLLDGGATVPLTPVYAPSLRARLALETLDHVTPFDKIAGFMLKERLRDFEKPIHLMTRAELVAAFGSSGAAEVIASDLIKNFLWQFVSRIRDGKHAPLEGGNVRSLWYIIKPALSRVNALSGMDHYKTLSDRLAGFVEKGIMRYREFGLAEEEAWSIGDRRPEIIIAAEKRAHYRFLQKIQAEHGVTVIALAGKPKQITSEYFTDAFKEKVPGYWRKDRVLVIGLIDYDPSGWIIERNFLKDLKVFGIRSPRMVDLVRPVHFTAEELENFKYSLTKPDPNDPEGGAVAAGDAATLKAWMRKFRGVNGEPFGLESDALMITPDKVRRMIAQAIAAAPQRTGRRHSPAA